jgi:hypothetical protein
MSSVRHKKRVQKTCISLPYTLGATNSPTKGRGAEGVEGGGDKHDEAHIIIFLHGVHFFLK